MSNSTPDADTYLIETKPGTESYTDSTLEKYYGDLFTEVSIASAPDDTTGIILIESDYELPLDAIRRINDVERVVRVEHRVSDIDGEGLEAVEYLCTKTMTSLPNEGSIELQVRSAHGVDDAITVSEIERTCRETIRDIVSNVTIDEKSTDCKLEVVRIDNWVGIVTTEP